MSSTRVNVFLCQAKVNQSDFVEGMFGIWQFIIITYEDVVKFQIVVNVPTFMNHFEGVKKLDTNLQYSLLTERLILVEEVLLHCVTKLVLDLEGPNHILDLLVGIPRL